MPQTDAEASAPPCALWWWNVGVRCPSICLLKIFNANCAAEWVALALGSGRRCCDLFSLKVQIPEAFHVFLFFFLNCVTAVQLCDGGSNEKAKDEILRVSCTVWSIKLSTLAHTQTHTHSHRSGRPFPGAHIPTLKKKKRKSQMHSRQTLEPRGSLFIYFFSYIDPQSCKSSRLYSVWSVLLTVGINNRREMKGYGDGGRAE